MNVDEGSDENMSAWEFIRVQKSRVHGSNYQMYIVLLSPVTIIVNQNHNSKNIVHLEQSVES